MRKILRSFSDILVNDALFHITYVFINKKIENKASFIT